MFPIFFSEISGMFPTVLTFPEKFASLIVTLHIPPLNEFSGKTILCMIKPKKLSASSASHPFLSQIVTEKFGHKFKPLP